MLFIAGVFIINFIALCKSEWRKAIIDSLINKKSKRIFLIVLFLAACAPALIGTLWKEAKFLELLLGNLLPNVFGALTVFSLIIHMSKFNYSNYLIKILRKDYFVNIIIKAFYYFCFFNSAVFYLDENWTYTNMLNNFYLFLVILSGLLVGFSFFHRLFIDQDTFPFPSKKVYPFMTLICGAAYLISCSIPSYIYPGKSAPILLTLNTITAFIMALAFLSFVIRKCDDDSKEYPFWQFGLFSAVIIANCAVYIMHTVEDLGDILYQFICGGGIMLAVIIALYILFKVQESNGKNEKEDEPAA